MCPFYKHHSVMVSECSLIDEQSGMYFMSQYICLDLPYARYGADAVGEIRTHALTQQILLIICYVQTLETGAALGFLCSRVHRGERDTL